MNSLIGNEEDHYSFTRILQLHASSLVDVLKKFEQQSIKLDNISDSYYATEMFEETNAKRNGQIIRIADYVDNQDEFVYSGPHYYISNPLNKNPRVNCTSKGDYDKIDLSSISENFSLRSVYRLTKEGKKNIPLFKGKKITENYRYINRKMAQPSNERTLISTIIPPKVSHFHSSISLTFLSEESMIYFTGLTQSIVYDFFVRCIGKPNIKNDILRLLPLPNDNLSLIIGKTLQLNCVSFEYSSIWNRNIQHIKKSIALSKNKNYYPDQNQVQEQWNHNSFLKSDIERRKIQIELDVIVAITIGLTWKELLSIYIAQFPVLQNYEKALFVDQNGRYVPKEVFKILDNKKMNITLPINFECYKKNKETVGEVKLNDGSSVYGIRWEEPKMEPKIERIYLPPFVKCDREKEMKQAYQYFSNIIEQES